MFHPLNRKFMVRVNGHLLCLTGESCETAATLTGTLASAVENLVVCAKEFIVQDAINAAYGLLVENCYFCHGCKETDVIRLISAPAPTDV